MSEQRFAELLPWYVNGTLDAADRAWVEEYLRGHPEARAELAWYRSFQSRIRESAPTAPPTIGLARTLALIRGDRPTLAERVRAFVGDFGLRPALAFGMLAVIVVQSGVIVNLWRHAEEDAVELRSLRATRVEEGPLLKLNFAPDAKEADIRMLLVSVQGTLAGGPGQLGDYYVRVPASKGEEVLARLRTNPLVQAAELVPGLPTRH
ncbi:MAG: hypothetical protein N2688_02975 [Burkholderiaceae bacterium]|nr:hypothetical protein [Burkholderiaceae bacterium]